MNYSLAVAGSVLAGDDALAVAFIGIGGKAVSWACGAKEFQTKNKMNPKRNDSTDQETGGETHTSNMRDSAGKNTSFKEFGV